MTTEIEVGTVIVATGLKITPRDAKAEYGAGKYLNVLDPLGMERIQSANGPYGHVLRPSDGKIPKSIAYIQCAGSRDTSLGVPYCSRVCCMYAIKQAILNKHLVHGVEVTIYHMDIRSFGKNFEQFYRLAQSEGIKFVKGKVAKICEVRRTRPEAARGGSSTTAGGLIEPAHDLVVLSLGVMPGLARRRRAGRQGGRQDGFFLTVDPKIAPTRSSVDGILHRRRGDGPKDIPDAIVEAGAAAMEAAMYLQRTGVSARARLSRRTERRLWLWVRAVYSSKQRMCSERG